MNRGDLEGAGLAIQRGAAIIDQFKLEDMNYVVEMLNGFLLREKGDFIGSSDAFRAALDRISHSVLGGSDLYEELPYLQAELARTLIEHGDLDEAEKALDSGFRLDPSEPGLWVSKARYQMATGLPQLARASVNYALAIWAEADPAYMPYIEALELEKELLRPRIYEKEQGSE